MKNNSSIHQVLRRAENELAAIADHAMLEAEILLAHVLQKPRSFLHAWPQQVLTEAQLTQFNDLIRRRLRREPIAYLTGTKEFWSLLLTVTPETLIPRPETELLIETVLTLFSKNETNIKLADLGTGSGAIALALAAERPAWQIYAVDISDRALQIASNNAQQLAIKNISFCHGSWCTALPCNDFDVIVSNPPYLSEKEWPAYKADLVFEPISALVSGEDGLHAIRVIVQQAPNYLKPQGYLLVEHGFMQGSAVRECFQQHGFLEVRTMRDLAGQERVTIGWNGRV